MRRGRRLLALNLALLFVFALLPLQALAADITLDTPVSYTVTEGGEHEKIKFNVTEEGFYKLTLTSPDHPDYRVVDSASTYGEMQLYSDGREISANYPIAYFLSEGEHVFYAKANDDPDWLKYYENETGLEGPAEDAGTWQLSVEKIEPTPLAFGEELHHESGEFVLLSFMPSETRGYVFTCDGRPFFEYYYDDNGYRHYMYDSGTLLYKDEPCYIVCVEQGVYKMTDPPREGESCGLKWSLSDDGVLTLSGNAEPTAGDTKPAQFYQDEVREIVIGKNVTVNSNLLDMYPNLEKITVEEGNTSCVLENGVLMDPSHTRLFRVLPEVTGNYTIPASVAAVADYAFSSAKGLTAITFTNPELYLRYYAVYPLDTLRDIYYPGDMNDFCKHVTVSFEWMEQVPNVHLDTDLSDGKFQYVLTESGDAYAIERCGHFAKDPTDNPLYRGIFTIPETFNGKPVTGICDGAFSSLYIGAIYIPETITDIAPAAFSSWNIEGFIVHPNNPVVCAKDEVLFSKDGKVLLAFPHANSRINEQDRYDVPQGTEVISAGMFVEGPHDLGLPLSLKKIEENVFLMTSVSDVYYAGTEADWANVEIATSPDDTDPWAGNNLLLNGGVKIHFAETHTHYYTSAVTAPTCTEQGYTTYTCVCGDSYKDNYVDAYGHFCDLYGAKDATCTEAGYTGDWVCVRCGETVEQGSVIAAKGHTWGDWTVTKAATEKEAGEQVRTCFVCGETETQTIEKLKPSVPEFTDLKPNAVYTKAVAWAVENGVTSGKTKTTFAPNDKCTRGEVVTFLWRAAGKPEPKNADHKFTDIKQGAFYYKAVLWAVENGVTSGTSETTFEPNKTCTRGEVVTFMYRAAGKPALTSTDTTFTDLKPKAFYYKAVLWAVANGITSGKSSTTFAPNDTCTRGEIVTFLYRGKDQIKPAT